MDSALSPVGRRIQPLSVAAFVRRAFAESIRPAIKDLTGADLTDAYWDNTICPNGTNTGPYPGNPAPHRPRHQAERVS